MNVDSSIALLLIRVVFGMSVAAHGAQKLFGWWGGPGLGGFAGWLGSMGVRSPKVSALFASLGEFGGGLLLALGLLTPLGALGVTTVMLTAVAMVHAQKGFWLSEGGWEYNLSIIAAAIAVATSGPGKYSVDELLNLTGSSYHGWMWGLGVLVIGLVLTGLNVVAKRKLPSGTGGEAAAG